MTAPLLALSIGCPSGVGPEIAVQAVATGGHRAILVGDPATIVRAARLRGIERAVTLVERARDLRHVAAGDLAVWSGATRLSRPAKPGAPNGAAGAAQLAWIDEATALVKSGDASALVTGPVSKHAIATSGARGAKRFLGHTEHLARTLGAPEVVMAFWADRLVTSLVTTHLPLAKVPRAITPEAVERSAYWLTRLLLALGAKKPLVAVASLNPHAGEGGLLGTEEIDRIGPGIDRARARLARDRCPAILVGPMGAETAMRRAAAGEIAGVVAMYHDQATIPSKLVAFGDAVNVTLGLPIVRTSVDHGTAYDVAWKGKADPGGMAGALELAARLSRAKRPPTDRASRG